MKIGRWFGSQIQNLETSALLGKGSKRLCFAFPGKDELCIKVGRPDLPWPVAQKQSFAEEAYLDYLVRRRGRHPDVFPQAFGWSPTNYGPGLVMERVSGPEGAASMSIRQLLEVGAMTAEEARQLMDRLKHRIIEQGLLVSDWNVDNVILSGNNGVRIPVMIDGFGPRRPDIKGFFFTRCRALARYKTRQSWRRQYAKLEASIRDPQSGKLS